MFRWVRTSDGWFPAEFRDDTYIAFLANKSQPSCNRYDLLELGPTIYRPIPAEHKTREYTPPAPIEVEPAHEEIVPTEKQFPHYHIHNFVPVSSQRRNDCSVIALANVASLTYKEAKLLCFHHGWSSTRGIDCGFLEVLLNTLGFETSYRSYHKEQSLRSFTADGVYLVYVKTHVMPYVNGVLYNMLNEDNCIQEVYEVTVKETVKC